MKVLVTGGSGFVGGALAKRLCKEGYQVELLSRTKGSNDADLNSITWHLGNLENRDFVLRACQGMDAIFHVAAKTGVHGSVSSYYNVNVLGTQHIIEACHKNNISKLIYTSTPSVIFNNQSICGLDQELEYPTHFLSAYAQTKAQAEKEILSANGVRNLNTISLRPHLIYGPGDTNLMPRLIRKAKAGKLFQVGLGQNKVDISYIDNVVEAHLAAFTKITESCPKCCGRPFFVADESPVNLWNWIHSFLVKVGAKEKLKKIPYPVAYFLGSLFDYLGPFFLGDKEPPMTRFLAMQLAHSHYFDLSRSFKDLEYQPRISGEKALEKTASYYQGS